MVRISFIMSLALAAQGILAAPAGTSVESQEAPNNCSASSSVPDRITEFRGSRPLPSVPEHNPEEEERLQKELEKEYKENKQKWEAGKDRRKGNTFCKTKEGHEYIEDKKKKKKEKEEQDAKNLTKQERENLFREEEKKNAAKEDAAKKDAAKNRAG